MHVQLTGIAKSNLRLPIWRTKNNRSLVYYFSQQGKHDCDVQDTLDTRRTGGNETMLGSAQEAVLARDTNAASRAGANQTVWQQYLGGLVMFVRPSTLDSQP